MGAGASTPKQFEQSQHSQHSQGQQGQQGQGQQGLPSSSSYSYSSFYDGSLSKSYLKMQENGLNDKEIYQNLRETYGSLRLNKKLVINEHTIRGLAIQKLSNTLETNRRIYPTPLLSSSSSLGIGNYNNASSNSSNMLNNSNNNNNNSSNNLLSYPLSGRKQHQNNNNNNNNNEQQQQQIQQQGTTSGKVNRKKPNLNIVVNTNDDNNNNEDEFVCGPLSNGQKTPRDRARLSPSGAVRVGNLAINEKGIQKSEFYEEKQAIGFLTAGRSDFVIVGSLGRGASGSVLEALHIPTLTIVALKLLPVYDTENLHNIASELDVLYRNLAELKLIDEILEDQDNNNTLAATPTSVYSRMSDSSQGNNNNNNGGMTVKSICPQVLAMYDAFLDPKSGMVNLVVEYMDGGSLQDVTDAGGCQDEAVLADIAYQVLLGLEFLHSHGHMHRDIKPGNILLNCRGVVKVADFGISKAMDSKDTLIGQNSFVGTMCYMAPERITNGAYSFPGDIWSFGLTLLAVMMGRFPLQSPSHLSYWDLLRIICDDDPPEPGDQFSGPLNMFINSCLTKEAKDRPSVIMLLQHPWFLQNPSAITNWKKARRNTVVASDLLVIDSDEENSAYRRVSSERSENDSENQVQSGLSKLTERTKTKYRANSMSEHDTEAGSSISIAPSAVCFGNYEPSQSVIEEDEEMTAVRLEHLERIFEKTDHRYEQMVAMYRKEKLLKQQMQQGGNINKSSHVGDRSSFRSMRSSRSFLKSPDDPLVPLPNFFTQAGSRKWNHLAHQLHLPSEIVTATAGNIINRKYFAREDSD